MKPTRLLSALLILAAASYVFLPRCVGQTAATGALTGVVTDPTAARVPGVQIAVTNEATGETRTVISGPDGTYTTALLSPGSYRVTVTKSGFGVATLSGIPITVAETAKLNIQLKVGAATEKVNVSFEPELAQTESSALGRVVDERVVTSLPLVTRNYTQIIGLSPGVTADVTNGAELGRGSGGVNQVLGATGRLVVHGARPYDNNFEMNGVGINDVESNGDPSGGISIPNPDTIEEFKVQTGQYDAGFGRNTGANVNIVTKGGSNEFHGTAFEFFRNEVLNANDFFFNRAKQRRPELRQNQFGGTLGGPIKKDKLFLFGSYQGTRQINGLANTQIAKCRDTVFSPPLTNDRSAAALGSLFAGQTGAFGGIAVAPDGSNINPVALTLLQLKLADGTYLMKTPQVIDPTKPFANQGFSAFSVPCNFNEDQFMGNGDILISARQKITERFFAATSDLNTTMAFNNVPGFTKITRNEFRDVSLDHTYVFNPRLLNQIQFGFHRVNAPSTGQVPFKFSDIGVAANPDIDANEYISILGSYTLATANIYGFAQNAYTLQDSLSYVRGRHTLRFGGGIIKTQDNQPPIHSLAGLIFLSFPDFLIGLDGPSNGTPFGNLFITTGLNGLTDREKRVFDGFGFAQDDIKVTARFTLNVGVRYERIGAFYDNLGRDVNFVPALANPTPSAAGTLQGFVVPSNYRGGAVPAEVAQVKHNYVTNGDGQNKLAPRIGFSWQPLPQSTRLVLRGGYGIYYSRPVGNPFSNLVTSPPWSLARVNIATGAALATWQNPWPQSVPPKSVFPSWFPYSPTTALDINIFALNFQPAVVQQYSFNAQTQIAHDFLLEVGYVGTKGTKLMTGHSANQAQLASASTPIRGITTNTVANISQRVPIEGFSPSGLRQWGSNGASYYNGLEVSVTKRFSKGLQFLASYTWSKNLDTETPVDFGFLNVGDQNNLRSHYGRANTDRPHRFVVGYTYEFPITADRNGLKGKVLGGWMVAGVTTFQSGQALTIQATNANNVYGINDDRAQLAPGCTNSRLGTPGSVNGKLNNYFNNSCFTTFPVIGDDGMATGFGNSGVGVLNGPDQRNFDIAIIKRTQVGWLHEQSSVEFRADMFNAFNTTQFANPDNNFSSPTFGSISSTAVSPRLIQLALKLIF